MKIKFKDRIVNISDLQWECLKLLGEGNNSLFDYTYSQIKEMSNGKIASITPACLCNMKLLKNKWSKEVGKRWKQTYQITDYGIELLQSGKIIPKRSHKKLENILIQRELPIS